MEQNEKIKLEVFNEINDEIRRITEVPCCKIKLSNEKCTIFDSKVGGIPYIPNGGKSPVDSKGNLLYLLAQINCEDISGLEDFPHSGMLQFFISDSDLYGCDYDVPTNQDGWRVVYYPTVDKNADPAAISAEFGGKMQIEFHPSNGEYKMSFKTSTDSMTAQDFRYEKLFITRWNKRLPNEKIDCLFDLEDSLFDILFDGLDSIMHRVGGYPRFDQVDPRQNDKYDTLLFQLDTDGSDGIDVMWGDIGVGNFFINREALKKLDFSDVLFNWDCG